jgi:hypothetical protein
MDTQKPEASIRTPAVLVNIGETIPDLPDIRLGTFIDEGECITMGEFDCPDGGYLIWNTSSDWFVVPKDEVLAVSPLPQSLLAPTQA